MRKIACVILIVLLSTVQASAWRFPPKPSAFEIEIAAEGIRRMQPGISTDEASEMARAALMFIWESKMADRHKILDEKQALESQYVPGSDYGQ